MVEHLGAVFFAIATVFGAAKRELVVGYLHGVHPCIAGFELVDGALSFVHVTRKDARPEAKLTRVGAFQRFVEVFDPHDWETLPPRSIASAS